MNIKECHVRSYQSQHRISYIHLCKNTNSCCFTKCNNIVKSITIRNIAILNRRSVSIVGSSDNCFHTTLKFDLVNIPLSSLKVEIL